MPAKIRKRGTPGRASSAKNGERWTLLIVDDIDTNRKLLRLQLRDLGHRVLEASDGAAALRLLRTRSVDAVVSDILMPHMDGYQLCLRVRQQPRFERLPFLFYSATYNATEDVRLARSVGADGLLPRPVNIEELVRTIGEVMRRSSGRRARRPSAASVSRTYTERLALKLEEKNVELERKRADLASREEMLHALIETAAELILLTDRAGRILTANAAVLQATGRSLEELQRMTFIDLVPEAERDTIRETIDMLASRSEVVRYLEVPIGSTDGSVRWLGLNARQRTLDGVPVGWYLIARDITELRQTQRALAASERRYRLLFDSNPLPMWVIDLDTLRFMAVNETAVRAYGYSREEFLSMTVAEIRPPEDVPMLLDTIRRDRSEVGTLGNARHRRKDGSLIYVELTGHDIDLDGRRSRLILANDITERLTLQEELAARERRLASFFTGSTAGLAIWDTDLRYVLVNETLAEINGWTIQQHLGRTVDEILPDLASVVGSMLRGVIATGEPILNVEVTGPTPKAPGVIRHWSASYFPIRGRNDQIEGVGGIIVETTAWKEAAKALADSEAELRALFSSMDEIVVVLDAEGHYLQIAPTNPARLKLPADLLLGRRVDEVMDPSEAGTIMSAVRTALGKRETVRVEYMLTIDGAEVWFEGAVSPMSSTSVLWVARDITDRRREHEAMEEMHRQLKYLFDTVDEAFFSLDVVNKRTLQVSPAMERIFGRSRSDFVADPMAWRLMVVPDDRQRIDAWLKELASGEAAPVQFRIRRPDGAVRWIETIIKPTVNDQGVVQRVDGVCFDITERRTVEQRLLEQAALLDQARESISVRDLDGTIIYWNKGSERLYGYASSEAVGQNVYRLLDSQPVSAVELARRQVIEKGEWVGELQHRHRSGTLVSVESHWTLVRDEAGRPRSVFVINTDITERRRLQAQLAHALKMESLGTLAGGIAHDFNNILGIILAHASLVESYLQEPTKIVNAMSRIMAAADRGAGLVRQLLTFARRSEVVRDHVNVNAIVEEVATLLRQTLPKTIEIDLRLGTDLPHILADVNQIHQVLVNLGVNARDAMPAGGRLTYSTSLTGSSPKDSLNSPPHASKHVLLVVEDSGVGMDDATKTRIFEPFFTTKEVGKGTGLGLATVFGIVQSHHGHIHVRSEPGAGTTFTIAFPVPDQDPGRSAEPASTSERSFHGTETVLLVEDEDDIRAAAEAALTRNGYTVLTARDGGEGFQRFSDHPDEVAVIVTDLGLPKMDGRSLIRLMRETGYMRSVIVTSGHIEAEVQLDLETLDVSRIMPKPYTGDEILMVIRDVLDHAAY